MPSSVAICSAGDSIARHFGDCSSQWLAGLPLPKGEHLCHHGHRPLLPLHLCQGGFGLGQPEGHVHSAVHLDSGRQRSAGLLLPSRLGV
jgi:hypothetical protein